MFKNTDKVMATHDKINVAEWKVLSNEKHLYDRKICIMKMF